MNKTNTGGTESVEMATFDLANYEVVADTHLPLELPNGLPMLGSDGEPVVFQIMSADDERFLKVQRRVIDERVARMKGKRNKTLSAAEGDAEATRLVAAGVTGWSNNVVWGGKPFSYTPDNAAAFVGRLRFVRDQVDAAINDRERFFAKPSTT